MHYYAEIHPETETVIRITSFPTPLSPERIKVREGRALMRPLVRADIPDSSDGFMVEAGKRMVVEPDRVVEYVEMIQRPNAREFVAEQIEAKAKAKRAAIIGTDDATLIEIRRLKATDAYEFLDAVRGGEPMVPEKGVYPMLDAAIPFEAKTHHEAATIYRDKAIEYAAALASIESKRASAKMSLKRCSDQELPGIWELVKQIFA